MTKSSSDFNSIKEKLRAYKKKYYLNLLLKGIIFSVAILSTSYILFNLLEYYGRFNTPVRIIFFFTFISLSVGVFLKWILQPIYKIVFINRQMSDEDASKQIGKFFPEVGDKLLNTLQLKNLSSESSSLVEASILQKTQELSILPFSNAVNLSENRKRAKVLILPFTVIFIILMFVPHLFVESTTRIIQYDKEFS